MPQKKTALSLNHQSTNMPTPIIDIEGIKKRLEIAAKLVAHPPEDMADWYAIDVASLLSALSSARKDVLEEAIKIVEKVREDNGDSLGRFNACAEIEDALRAKLEGEGKGE